MLFAVGVAIRQCCVTWQGRRRHFQPPQLIQNLPKQASRRRKRTETPGSESEVDSPRRPVIPAPAPMNARAERVTLGTANKALLGNMGKEEAQKCFRAFKANSRESPLTRTKLFGKLTGGMGLKGIPAGAADAPILLQCFRLARSSVGISHQCANDCRSFRK